MFKLVQTSSENSNIILTIAQVCLDIVSGSNSYSSIDTMSSQLKDIIKSKSPEEQELLKLDAFQGIFITEISAHGSNTAIRANALYDHLFNDISFCDFDTLWSIHKKFMILLKDFSALEVADELAAIAKSLGTNSIIAYCIYRELLNLFMRTLAFMERLDLVQDMITEIDRCDPEVRTQAEKLGGEIFFYGGHGMQVHSV